MSTKTPHGNARRVTKLGIENHLCNDVHARLSTNSYLDSGQWTLRQELLDGRRDGLEIVNLPTSLCRNGGGVGHGLQEHELGIRIVNGGSPEEERAIILGKYRPKKISPEVRRSWPEGFKS
jgi:hypothetical protein